MIPAFRAATTNTARALEIVRMVLIFLVLGGLIGYALELYIIGHWLPTFESQIPFYVTVPGVLFSAWVFFDRRTPWVRVGFIVTMWLMVLTGVLGAYYHWVWNMEDAGGVNWAFMPAMEEFHGFRPVLAALAYTNMGITGLVCIFRAR
jgi:drug/metabolite transporter (DMT)-like permease